VLENFPGRDFVEMHVWDEAQNKTIVCKMGETVNKDANGLHAELIELFGGEAVREA